MSDAVDGLLKFKVNIHDEVTEWEGDLVLLKLLTEDVEKKHDLGLTDDKLFWRPTAEFLVDLAAAYERFGFKGCTPTIADRVWKVVSAQFIRYSAETKKLTLEAIQ